MATRTAAWIPGRFLAKLCAWTSSRPTTCGRCAQRRGASVAPLPLPPLGRAPRDAFATVDVLIPTSEDVHVYLRDVLVSVPLVTRKGARPSAQLEWELRLPRSLRRDGLVDFSVSRTDARNPIDPVTQLRTWTWHLLAGGEMRAGTARWRREEALSKVSGRRREARVGYWDQDTPALLEHAGAAFDQCLEWLSTLKSGMYRYPVAELPETMREEGPARAAFRAVMTREARDARANPTGNVRLTVTETPRERTYRVGFVGRYRHRLRAALTILRDEYLPQHPYSPFEFTLRAPRRWPVAGRGQVDRTTGEVTWLYVSRGNGLYVPYDGSRDQREIVADLNSVDLDRILEVHRQRLPVLPGGGTYSLQEWP